jgi:transcription-repair coupling factor (superfamily II helicase)
MEVYRRIADCRQADQLDQLARDLADAYGKLPPAVATLLELAEIRIRAAVAGINSIVRMDPDIIFTVKDFKKAQKLFDKIAGSVRLPDEQTIHWRPPKAYLELPSLIAVLLRRLRPATS